MLKLNFDEIFFTNFDISVLEDNLYAISESVEISCALDKYHKLILRVCRKINIRKLILVYISKTHNSIAANIYTFLISINIINCFPY